MKILFHEDELNYRGTSIAVYDYADFNERYLGNESKLYTTKTQKPITHSELKSLRSVSMYMVIQISKK